MTPLEWIMLAPTIVGVASAISRLTKTQKDDRFLAKVQKVVDKLALIGGNLQRK